MCVCCEKGHKISPKFIFYSHFQVYNLNRAHLVRSEYISLDSNSFIRTDFKSKGIWRDPTTQCVYIKLSCSRILSWPVFIQCCCGTYGVISLRVWFLCRDVFRDFSECVWQGPFGERPIKYIHGNGEDSCCEHDFLE